MQIRRATAQDIPGIHGLLSQVNAIHHEGRPDLFDLGNKYTDEQLGTMVKDDTNPIFVAVADDAPAGQILGYAFCEHQQIVGDTIRTPVRTLYIDDLCVDAEARGLHVGTRLYDHVVAYARANDYYNLTLNVWALNAQARGFYDHLGMQPQKTYMEQIL